SSIPHHFKYLAFRSIAFIFPTIVQNKTVSSAFYCCKRIPLPLQKIDDLKRFILMPLIKMKIVISRTPPYLCRHQKDAKKYWLTIDKAWYDFSYNSSITLPKKKLLICTQISGSSLLWQGI
uniref:Uncharacterized protein n=1 Tax=Glossina palpalis gambiensis TaxID=67801 RepID=A0A1B0BVT8_9MUSC